MHVFVSYCSEDFLSIERIINGAKGELASSEIGDPVDFFIDRRRLIPGDPLNEELESKIARDMDLFLVFISNNFPQSLWVNHELHHAMERARRDLRFRILPVLMHRLTSDTKKALTICGANIDEVVWLSLDGYDSTALDNLARELAKTMLRIAQNPDRQDIPDIEPLMAIRPLPTCAGTPLSERLSERLLVDGHAYDELEEAAINAVVMGGVTAMGFYAEVRAHQEIFKQPGKANPSTLADVNATAAILAQFHGGTTDLRRRLRLNFVYLGGRIGPGAGFVPEDSQRGL